MCAVKLLLTLLTSSDTRWSTVIINQRAWGGFTLLINLFFVICAVRLLPTLLTSRDTRRSTVIINQRAWGGLTLVINLFFVICAAKKLFFVICAVRLLPTLLTSRDTRRSTLIMNPLFVMYAVRALPGLLVWSCTRGFTLVIDPFFVVCVVRLSLVLMTWRVSRGFTPTEPKTWSKHSTAQVDATGSDWSTIVGSTHQAGVVSLVALVAICTGLSLTADKSLKKTRPTCFLFQCKHSKRRKKEKEKRKLHLQGNYKLLWCAITTYLCHYVVGRFCSKSNLTSLHC